MPDTAFPPAIEAGPLDWLVLGEMIAVNQVLTHAMVLGQDGLHEAAEAGYDIAVAAMNRSMRLMLALQADGAGTRFRAADAPGGRGILVIGDEPAGMLASDRECLERLLADYDAAAAAAPTTTRMTMRANRAEVAAQQDTVARFIGSLAAGGLAAMRSDRSPRTDGGGLVAMREASRAYFPSWGTFDRDAPGEPVPMPWAGEIVGMLLGGMIQVFAHAFGQRACGRYDLANRQRTQALADMRTMYVLLTLALERGLPAGQWRPDGRAWPPTVAADHAGMVACDRAYAIALLECLDRHEQAWADDLVAAPILRSLQSAHRTFASELAAPNADAPDHITGMLARWGIADPTA